METENVEKHSLVSVLQLEKNTYEHINHESSNRINSI